MSDPQIIASRFEVLGEEQSGGMATVFRARDTHSGDLVALKLLRGADPQHVDRMAREARVLAKLHHPAIVRYVAHGQDEQGQSYLAMEWLEGEDLDRHLRFGPMSVEATMRLGRRVAEGLAEAHAQGLVHRDIKPGNVFLCDAEPGNAKLLDFGLVRLDTPMRMTRTGMVMGTPGYMAPEQARSEQDIDARADMFSLGCLLFECLTARPPFTGDNVMAVLAKILVEDAPRVRSLRSDCPDALDELVARLLEKDRDRRSIDAATVAVVLTDLRSGSLPPAPARERVASLTDSEQRLVCMVMALPEPTRDGTAHAPTLESSAIDASLRPLSDALQQQGGTLIRLVDGSLLVSVSNVGVATDQAVRAARCALALREAMPRAAVALATGFGSFDGAMPHGEVIDRAASLLAEAAQESSAAARPVLVDAVSHGLLDGRFLLERRGEDAALLGAPARAPARTLLGRVSPFVGRKRELAMLQATIDESAEQSVAQVVLVSAPAGYGKSRLRQELVLWAEKQSEAPHIWLGRANSVGVGSPFGLIAPGLRALASIHDDEPVEVSRAKLKALVRKTIDEAESKRVATFLGEVISVPFDEQSSVQLAAARRDARVMTDQMLRAWLDFVRTACARQPLIIIIEDLHWGDVPSVRFIDAALRELDEAPLTVLAFARPEVHDAFPELWSERGLTEISLRSLPKKAGAKLVRMVLGDDTDDEQVDRLVERSEGNALYLEELIRARQAGTDDALPETVLAMVQARVQRLPADARRVLRAASVFGRTFWDAGVELLVGEGRRTETRQWLQSLVDDEVIQEHSSSSHQGAREYVFRHALVREAAYAMLTAEDKRLGHELAATWLEQRGSREALALAQHWQRCQIPERAVRWYLTSAAQAIDGNDLKAAGERAALGVECGADGRTRGELRLIEARVHRWLGHADAGIEAANEALALLEEGSALWYRTLGQLAELCGVSADHEALGDVAKRIRQPALDASAEAERAIAAAHAVVQFNHTGSYHHAQELLDWIRAAAQKLDDPLVAGWIERAAFMRAAAAVKPGLMLEAGQASVDHFSHAGDVRMATMQRLNVGYVSFRLGQHEQAEQELRRALDDARALHLAIVGSIMSYLAYAVGLQGRLADAERYMADALNALSDANSFRMEARARMYLSQLLVDAGRLGDAEREALHAVKLCETLPSTRELANVYLAQVLLAQQRHVDALELTSHAMDHLRAQGSVEDGEPLLRWVHARTLQALGSVDEARAAIEHAATLVHDRAASIRDASVRKSFLERVHHNAATLEMAAALAR